MDFSQNNLHGSRTQEENKAINTENLEFISHEQVLKSLLSEVKPIDFAQRAGVIAGTKISRQEIVVISIDALLELSILNNWGLIVQNNQVSVFNGAYWKVLEQDAVKQFLGQAVALLGYDPLKSRYHSFVEDLFKQLQSVGFMPKKMRSKKSISINFMNGTLEISKDGDLYFRGFDPSDYFFYQLPFEYDPTAKISIFQDFMDRVLVDSAEQKILSEYCGYIFIRNSTLKLEKALILFGTGANGKSTFFEILYALLQSENISTFSLQSLTNESGYQRAQIQNKLLNYASEIGVRMDSAIFKQISSGEPVEARLPYGSPFIIEDYAKLIFNTNELPKEVENNPGYFRRFIILNFDQTIPENERDPKLAQKIISNELAGVFNWMLDGMKRLLEQNGFTDSDKSQQTLNEFKKQSDSVAMMINELNYITGHSNSMSLKQSYEYYRKYCVESGFKPCAINRFSDRLRKLGFTVKRNKNGQVLFFDIFSDDATLATSPTPIHISDFPVFELD